MHAACCMSYDACRMPHVACRMSHVACRMSHVACRVFGQLRALSGPKQTRRAVLEEEYDSEEAWEDVPDSEIQTEPKQQVLPTA